MSKATSIFLLVFISSLIITIIILSFVMHSKNEKIKELKIKVETIEREVKTLQEVTKKNEEINKKYKDLKTKGEALSDEVIDDFSNLFDLFLSNSP